MAEHFLSPTVFSERTSLLVCMAAVHSVAGVGVAASIAAVAPLPKRSGVDNIADDLIEHVVDFLAPVDMLIVMQVNGYWKEICQRDAMWRRYCASRWRIDRPRSLLRMTGTENFYELYFYLHRNRFMPRGRFTPKNQLAWGRARQEGADAWITIAHRSDCRTVSRGSTTSIQLRIVLQNLLPRPLTVDIQDIKVHMKSGYMGRVLGLAGNATESSLAPKVVAFNGEAVSSPTGQQWIQLQMFEFAVVAINIECKGCEFEADFLESCCALWLPIRRVGACQSLTTCRCRLIPDNYHHGSIRVPVVDESIVWKHYTYISSRVMVLDCRDSLEHQFAGSNLLNKPSTKTNSVRKTTPAVCPFMQDPSEKGKLMEDEGEKESAVTHVQEAKKTLKSPWLSAYHNSVAGIRAFSSCMCLVDVYGDGDSKLIVADADKRLKMFKGSSLHAEQVILGVPSALSYFYSDTTRPRVPAIAVASGSFIYIYRNFRPHYKFTVPALEVDAEEQRLWEALAKCTIEIPATLAQLTSMRGLGIRLTERSRGLLAIDDIDEQAEYVTRFMDEPLIERSNVTCLASVKKNMDDKDAVSCLVVGTETSMVYVLDPQGTSVIQQVKVPGIPVEIVPWGLFDVECRLILTTRSGSVYTIKNGELLKTVIELEATPCGLLQLEKSMVVASMNRKLTSYHLKGKKNWSLTMADDIVAIEAFSLRTKEARGVLVALRNGDVILYNEKVKICTLNCDTLLTGIVFGQYGREDACLVLVQKNGALSLKILKRTASLEAISEAAGPPPEQDIPLNIPKKTKLYVEQTQRERDHATEMHRHFQRDLCKLRLTTARAYVKIIKDGQGPVSYSTSAAIRLNAQIQGIGPHFRIKLNVQNAGTKAVTNITIASHFDHSLYRMTNSLLLIPLVIPNVQYVYTLDVECISDSGAADTVSIFVCGKDSCIPLVSAVVNMPLSEPEL